MAAPRELVGVGQLVVRGWPGEWRVYECPDEPAAIGLADGQRCIASTTRLR